MPYSMVLAEPVGLVAGVVAGRVGGRIGRYFAEQLGIPTWLGGMISAATCHYLSAALTKAIINASLLDAPGGVANVAVTSPMTSVAHGLFDALSDAIPGLGEWLSGLADDPEVANTIQEFLGDALPTTPEEICDALAEADADPNAFSPDQIDAVAATFANTDATPLDLSLAELRFGGFDAMEATTAATFPACAGQLLLPQSSPQWVGNPFAYQQAYYAPYHQYNYYRQWWEFYGQWWEQHRQWWLEQYRQWFEQQASTQAAAWALQNPETIAQQFADTAGINCPPIERVSNINDMSDALRSSPAVYSHDCGWLSHLLGIEGGKIQINEIEFPEYVGKHGVGAYWTVGHELGHFYDLHHTGMLPFKDPDLLVRAERNADYFAGVLFRLTGKDPAHMQELFVELRLFPGSDRHLPGPSRWKDFMRGWQEGSPKWHSLFSKGSN
jgi:hypothetical protein